VGAAYLEGGELRDELLDTADFADEEDERVVREGRGHGWGGKLEE
jgi:hypothetical protein